MSHVGLDVRRESLRLVAADTSFGQLEYPAISGGDLWVVDLVGDPSLHVVDLTTGRLRYSTGAQGEGPGEFISLGNLSPSSTGSGVWGFDGNTNRMTEIRDSAGVPVVTRIANLPTSPRPRRVVQRGNGFAFWSSDSGAQLVITDSNARIVRSRGGFLLGGDSVTSRRRINLSTANTICARPDGDRVAVGYLAAGKVVIYDVDRDSILYAKVPFPSEGVFERNDAGEVMARRPVLHYVSCAATEGMIYMLFSGRHMPVPPPDAWRDGPEASTMVYVFDWEGNPLRYLELDQAVTSIAVSADGQTLIGVDRRNGRILRGALGKW